MGKPQTARDETKKRHIFDAKMATKPKFGDSQCLTLDSLTLHLNFYWNTYV